MVVGTVLKLSVTIGVPVLLVPLSSSQARTPSTRTIARRTSAASAHSQRPSLRMGEGVVGSATARNVSEAA